MILIGTFSHGLELEQALAVLEHRGIPRQQLMVVLMDSTPEGMQSPGDVVSRAVEIGVAFATGLAVLGASVGFTLPWGPILCGLFAALAGFGLGFGIVYTRSRRQSGSRRLSQLPEVTVIVECSEAQSREVRDILWTYEALTVGCVSGEQAAPSP